jgi:hypothetical protein
MSETKAKRRIYTVAELEAIARSDNTRGDYRNASACRSHRDGDCCWPKCPQNADNEPTATGRHCPLDLPPFRAEDDEW